MHHCGSRCHDGFHYSSTSPSAVEEQERSYAADLSRTLEKFETGQPRPDKYEIIDYEVFGPYLVLNIKYPNCTNFSGLKILVVKATVKELVLAKHIDPHFSEDKKAGSRLPSNRLSSPIARFPPTDEGRKMAVRFASMLCSTPSER
ncbi:MAG: hypothetical protein WC761_02010 [Candidatus Paceibacterota bacterium]|jgi:hypothetical protein